MKTEKSGVILYTIGCPKCKILETKLNQKNIPHTICDDRDIMNEMGFDKMPMLFVEGANNDVTMNYAEAIKWVNNY